MKKTIGFFLGAWVPALLFFLFLVDCRTTARDKPQHPGHAGFMRVGAVWDDPQRCKETVADGGRLNRAAFRLRLASWDVRWFPDTRPGFLPADIPTDVEWVACIITWMDPDVLALQEVKQTARGIVELEELAKRLSTLTGVEWKWVTDSCPDPTRQHTAFLYRTDRVDLSAVATHPEIDPTEATGKQHAECPGWLRPALGAYVSSKSGGADFHLITLHLDVGTEKHDLDNRQQAWRRLAAVRAARQALRPDNDVVVVGDFNTIGCPECGVADGEAERRALSTALAGAAPPALLVAPSVPCTGFYHGGPTLTDHWVVDAAMEEAADHTARVLGVCAATRCQNAERDRVPALQHMSDHCPLVLDLVDRDIDPVSGPAVITGDGARPGAQ